MTTLLVTEPFRSFPDVDGTPVDDGYIYVGVASLNPETNPLQAYWDEALIIPANQPVRTLNGFASRAGSPGNLYVGADDYSITVRNKNGSLIYLSQNNRPPPALWEHQMLAATIENTGSGWAFVGDTAGFTGVSVNVGGEIELEHPSSVTVSSVLGQSDKNSIGVSARDEATKTTLSLSASLNFEVDTETGNVTAESYWGSDISSVIVENYCNITHPSTDFIPNINDVGSSVDRTKIRVKEYTNTTLKLAGMGDLCGYVTRETGSWEYNGKMKNIPSLSWVPFAIQIDHETVENNNALQVSSPYQAYHAVPDSGTIPNNQTSIVFLDGNTGETEVVETSLMRAYFNRFYDVEYNYIHGNVAINRGFAKINAGSLINSKIKVFGGV